MTIQFYRKNVYGNELMYIQDSQIARAVRELSGHESLPAHAKCALESLGHTFEEVLAPQVSIS